MTSAGGAPFTRPTAKKTCRDFQTFQLTISEKGDHVFHSRQLKQTKPVSVWRMEVFNVLYLLSDTYKLTFITLNSVRSPNNKCTMFTAGMRTNDLIFEQLRINKLIKNWKISMKPKRTGMLPTQNRKKIITFDNILGYICIF